MPVWHERGPLDGQMYLKLMSPLEQKREHLRDEREACEMWVRCGPSTRLDRRDAWTPAVGCISGAGLL